MALMVRPLGAVAEAANRTGEGTVAPAAGAETFTPAVLLTVMVAEATNDCPVEFHDTGTMWWDPGDRLRLVLTDEEEVL